MFVQHIYITDGILDVTTHFNTIQLNCSLNTHLYYETFLKVEFIAQVSH